MTVTARVVGAPTWSLRRFADMDCLARILAAEISSDLSNAIDTRGAASLIVPGGGTPRPLFDALARQPLTWPQVTVGLTDERWVALDSDDSNEAQTRRHLLQYEARKAIWAGLWNDAPTLVGAAEAAGRRYENILRPFDVVVLGMGDDGHVASLFPGDVDIAAKLDPMGTAICVVGTAPVAPYERLSLGLSALVACRRLILLIRGEGKLQLLRSSDESDAGAQLPVHAVLAAAGPAVEVVWAP